MTDPEPETPPIRLLVDADACPVREECVKVALRHGIKVTFVSNSYFRIETDPLVEREIVPGNFDAADDRIVEHVTKQGRGGDRRHSAGRALPEGRCGGGDEPHRQAVHP
jgi:hypothetical protein